MLSPQNCFGFRLPLTKPDWQLDVLQLPVFFKTNRLNTPTAPRGAWIPITHDLSSERDASCVPVWHRCFLNNSWRVNSVATVAPMQKFRRQFPCPQLVWEHLCPQLTSYGAPAETMQSGWGWRARARAQRLPSPSISCFLRRWKATEIIQPWFLEMKAHGWPWHGGSTTCSVGQLPKAFSRSVCKWILHTVCYCFNVNLKIFRNIRDIILTIWATLCKMSNLYWCTSSVGTVFAFTNLKKKINQLAVLVPHQMHD